MERLTFYDNEKDLALIKDLDKAVEKLAAYKTAEVQGLLLKPKVALNSYVYLDSGYWGIIPYKVCNINYNTYGFYYEICAFKENHILDDKVIIDDDFEKTVYLTKEDAEIKLNPTNQVTKSDHRSLFILFIIIPYCFRFSCFIR